jgi:predicted ABC-type ATPase
LPEILVLAGVNGAGKSSVVGARLKANEIDWFNPDEYTRGLIAAGCGPEDANAGAWQYGRERLEEAILTGADFAFETTLGGNTISALLRRAAATHDVHVLYVGLASVELHLQRVALRVARGGHTIPEQRVRERWETSRANLCGLVPLLASLQVYDNSGTVRPGSEVPPPVLVIDYERGKLPTPAPDDVNQLANVPDWAKCIFEAVLQVVQN